MAKEMRKTRTGKVVRTKMDKTAVVETVWRQRHQLYRKQVRRLGRFNVHDPLNRCQLGDLVRIQEVRPISKTKRWRLLEILESRQVADVRPIDLESDAEVSILDDSAVAQDELEANAGELPADSEYEESGQESEGLEPEDEDIEQ